MTVGKYVILIIIINIISSLYLSLYRKLHTCVHSILRLSKTGKSAFNVIINKVVDNHKVVYIIIMHFNTLFKLHASHC